MSDQANNFALKLANVNGTGSASANGMLMQAIFRMGIPVSGKNLFPSNIQGLPTWYEIRVNGDGHTARTERFDIMVAMNAQTYKSDVQEVVHGGYLLHDSSFPMGKHLDRDDITFLGVPLAEMCNTTFEKPRERILMKNIAYVGALAALLDIDMDTLSGMLHEKFSKKATLLDSNDKAIRLGYDFAKEHFDCPLPIRLSKLDKTRDHIMIDGNTAAALGCVYAGATVASWYPITPSTSLVDAFTGFCKNFRTDKDSGEKTHCIIQAEDELAAIGMVLGATWNGARAFTATSGPGISLMNEFIGLAYYAEVPAVIFDIQRTGPSTGMPTRTQQADLLECAYASHGDTRHICLYPADPNECFYMARDAFDYAERFQTPVFVVSDLDIGMNDWMCPNLEWDDKYKPDRGKILTAQDLEQLPVFHRYLDEDGDGIASRTLPGVHPKGAYFTRGSGHTKYGTYTENPAEYQEVMDRLKRKSETARQCMPASEIVNGTDSKIGLLALGGTRGAILEALEELNAKKMACDFLRIKAFPFADDVHEFLASHERVYVIEQNRDAQLRNMLLMETDVEKAKLRSILQFGGFPLSACHVVDAVLEAEGKA